MDMPLEHRSTRWYRELHTVFAVVLTPVVVIVLLLVFSRPTRAHRSQGSRVPEILRSLAVQSADHPALPVELPRWTHSRPYYHLKIDDVAPIEALLGQRTEATPGPQLRVSIWIRRAWSTKEFAIVEMQSQLTRIPPPTGNTESDIECPTDEDLMQWLRFIRSLYAALRSGSDDYLEVRTLDGVSVDAEATSDGFRWTSLTFPGEQCPTHVASIWCGIRIPISAIGKEHVVVFANGDRYIFDEDSLGWSGRHSTIVEVVIYDNAVPLVEAVEK